LLVIKLITSYVEGRHAPASWPLTFLSWNRCPSHGWRGLRLCRF